MGETRESLRSVNKYGLISGELCYEREAYFNKSEKSGEFTITYLASTFMLFRELINIF
jgi:hypothetical protein